MTSEIIRQNSSKQGLQNLLRLTTQRSIEDAEEIERERRRRERKDFCSRHISSGSDGSSPDGTNLPEIRLTIDVDQTSDEKKDVHTCLDKEKPIGKIQQTVHKERQSQWLETLWHPQFQSEQQIKVARRWRKGLRKAPEDEKKEQRIINNQVTERTDTLNRSLKKCVPKTQRLKLVSNIDDKLEHFAHAVEISGKEAKATKGTMADPPFVSAPVALKKNIFEAGATGKEAAVQKKISPIKVVKPGDVLQKKNMWEIIGEVSAAEISDGKGKTCFSGKQFKFVVTGHGKYEKIFIDDHSTKRASHGFSSGN